jgi:hypothetical protein
MDIMMYQATSSPVIWVPCLPDYSSGNFIPVYSLNNLPSSLSEKISHLPRGGVKSKPWKHEEDSKLRELIEKTGVKKWAKIASELNSCFFNDRKGKNCRDRWNNHLNPEINKGEWTFEEDLNLLKRYLKEGRKWSLIAKEFRGRTENSIKNRWNTLVKSCKSRDTEADDVVRFLIFHLEENVKGIETGRNA